MEAAVDDTLCSDSVGLPDPVATGGAAAPKKRRKRYSLKAKREALRAAEGLSQREAARQQGVPRWTLNDWRKAKDDIANCDGSEKRLSRGPGRPEMVPFGAELVTFMKYTRRDWEVLTAKVMASFVRDQYPDWLAGCVDGKKNAERRMTLLICLLRRFTYRHGFVQRTPSGLKEKLLDLVAVRDEFAKTFNTSYGSYDASLVYNTDETGIYFDCPSSKMLGKQASITAEKKHSARLTAVCTIRADGLVLPLLFIVRGEPGGSIEQEELKTYPKGHVYAVQSKAWTDTRVWEIYLCSLLAYHITKGSVLLVDNLDCHVSAASEAIVTGELGCTLQALPKNATSVCQPLDVGVMGPLKAMFKELWLEERPPPPPPGQKPKKKTAKVKRIETINRTIQA